jgi:hypothetical protein
VLFVLSFGLGIGLKSAAHTVVTIGYADYRLMPAERLYDLNVLRERALENGATLPVQEKREYPACSLSSLDDVDPSS